MKIERKHWIKATIGIIVFLVGAIVVSYFIARGLFAISQYLQPFSEMIVHYSGLLVIVVFVGLGIFFLIQFVAEKEQKRANERKGD